jgi:hypothetical protein
VKTIIIQRKPNKYRINCDNLKKTEYEEILNNLKEIERTWRKLDESNEILNNLKEIERTRGKLDESDENRINLIEIGMA